MSVELIYERPDGTAVLFALSGDTKPTNYRAGSTLYTDDRAKFEFYGKNVGWILDESGGAAHVIDGFKPSQYDTNLTMDADGVSLALATGVKLGAGRVQIANLGVTTEAVRAAFGTDAANAESNLNIAAGAATTGTYIGASADLGSQSIQILGVPALAEFIHIAPAVAGKTNDVAVTQGI